MMDAGFVKEIRDGAQSPLTHEIEGRARLALPPGWHDGTPKLPEVEHLRVATLTGLRDYCAANVDGLVPDKLLLHVTGPASAALVGPLGGRAEEFQRHLYVRAEADASGFQFGKFHDAEQFMVALQTQFGQTPERDEVIALVAGVKESDVREVVDDGVAQQVNVSAGVALVGRQKIPNPVALKPWRTFRELEQPESEFVLRARKGAEGGLPSFALFECDGGAWRIEAIDRVAKWLVAEVPAVKVVA